MYWRGNLSDYNNRNSFILFHFMLKIVLEMCKPLKTFWHLLLSDFSLNLPHSGTMLFDLRPDWLVKVLSPAHLSSNWSRKKADLSIPHPIGCWLRQYPYASKSPPPSKKLVCGFHWLWHRNVLPWRLGCSRYVPVWGIMLLVEPLVSW